MLASFFFWKPGIQLQKSLGGLFRSLLYEILKLCPELIPAVLSDQWQIAEVIPWQARNEIEFSIKNLAGALLKVVQNRSICEKYCFCYFIDGLDEFEETRQEDYKSIIDTLNQWTLGSLDLKICVSSRV